MDFFTCVSLPEAETIVFSHLKGIFSGTEMVDLDAALGRVTAETVVAPEDVPLFARSTVDGFAVRAADTFGAAETAPALFAIGGEVAMGKAAEAAVGPGLAVAVPTGGMLPPGADAVVMLEATEQPAPEMLLVLKAVAPGENVVARGEDMAAGSIIIPRGRRLRPQDLGALAACGVTMVRVRTQPRVVIISTGDEVVEAAQRPGPGQVRDINSHALAGMLQEFGCAVHRAGIVKDDYPSLLAAVTEAASSADLIVLSGGSSVGARDHTVKVIDALGPPGILVHGVAIKPGKPTIFGMAGKVPVFGLPGHPVAAMTVCRLLVKPAVDALLGREDLVPPLSISARLTRNVASSPGRDDYIRVRLRPDGAGGWLAEPVFGKSGLITTMTVADAVVRIAAEQGGVHAGDLVAAEPLRTW